jgi:carbohydrate kinase (thermoresistant glucokinase family)
MTHKVFIVMGVSGTGKSTIGKLLAQKLNVPFFDGDDFHPEENVAKMASGQPLNDTDRHGWLKALNELCKKHETAGAVVACSALKSSYRDILSKELNKSIQFIYLEGTFELVKARMIERTDHFMPIKLLKSQFDTLEPPVNVNAITISINHTPTKIISLILNHIHQ